MNANASQIEALKICAQLLEVGTFSLSGKDMAVAIQARQILEQFIKDAEAPAVTPEVLAAP